MAEQRAVSELKPGDQIEVGIFRAVVNGVDRDVPTYWPKGSAVLSYTYLNHRSVPRSLRGHKGLPKPCMLTDTVTTFTAPDRAARKETS